MQNTPPTRCKAAILTEIGAPLTLAEIDLPETLEAGQVLVKLRYSGICGSQLGEIDGVKGNDPYLPHLLGHEGSGTVLEVGPGVRHVQAGDVVVLHWRKGLGIDAVPPAYKWDGKRVNAGQVTTFNDHAVVAENRLTAIRADIDLEVAALFGCAVTTGFGVVQNNAQLKIGESIVVYGAGGVGLNIIQAASLVSAHPIIAVDQYDGRLALAREMGATHTINGRTQDAAAEIRSILNPKGLDVFIDNTGIPDIIALGYDLTHAQGRVILVGVPRAGNQTDLYTLPLHFGKVLTGSHGGEAVPQIDIPRYSEMYCKGLIKLKELVTHRVGLDAINDAIAGMRDGSINGRVLIDFEG